MLKYMHIYIQIHIMSEHKCYEQAQPRVAWIISPLHEQWLGRVNDKNKLINRHISLVFPLSLPEIPKAASLQLAPKPNSSTQPCLCPHGIFRFGKGPLRGVSAAAKSQYAHRAPGATSRAGDSPALGSPVHVFHEGLSPNSQCKPPVEQPEAASPCPLGAEPDPHLQPNLNRSTAKLWEFYGWGQRPLRAAHTDSPRQHTMGSRQNSGFHFYLFFAFWITNSH